MKKSIICLAALFLAACGEPASPAKECLTLYSGGIGIGSFKGERPRVVSSDGSILFKDDVKGWVKLRGDWVAEPCQ